MVLVGQEYITRQLPGQMLSLPFVRNNAKLNVIFVGARTIRNVRPFAVTVRKSDVSRNVGTTDGGSD
jgi:hypothetical protein